MNDLLGASRSLRDTCAAAKNANSDCHDAKRDDCPDRDSLSNILRSRCCDAQYPTTNYSNQAENEKERPFPGLFWQWPPEAHCLYRPAQLAVFAASHQLAPNARVKPTCVVEPKSWQAFSAMTLVERSKFGLNELLGGQLELGRQLCEAIRHLDRHVGRHADER